MINSKTFGATIRHRREHLKISLRSLARDLNLSATYISKVERGQELPPKEEHIAKIAELLDLDFDELIVAAGRVPDELTEMYLQQPSEVMALLRSQISIQTKSKSQHEQ